MISWIKCGILPQCDQVKKCAFSRLLFLGRAINLPSVDNASRREPPLVTASRMGLLEAAALLVTHGADLEARDGQGRTALWHAVREEEDGIVEMLIHAGAKVFLTKF